jgi:hypothetical protein
MSIILFKRDVPNARLAQPIATRSRDMEPLDIDHEAEQRLNRTDDQKRDVMAASPETPAEGRNDGARHDENQEETEDVIPESHIAAADCSRSKEMPEKTEDKEYDTEPNPGGAPWGRATD